MFLKNFCTLRLTLSLVNGNNAEPLWWDRISTEFDGGYLETCVSESEAPVDGTRCPNILPETCFFGTQDCDGVGAHPETKCFCDGETGSQEWKCEEETCPAFPPPSAGWLSCWRRRYWPRKRSFVSCGWSFLGLRRYVSRSTLSDVTVRRNGAYLMI